MLILGIESSCDETSAAVVQFGEDNRRILSNIVASQIETHRLYGGVVPEIASRAHIQAVSGTARNALETAGVTIEQIELVAVTAYPGLIGALLVGVNFAKSLAYARNIPLVAVNHVKAHVFAAYLENPNLRPPFVAAVLSGGHSSIYYIENENSFLEIGSTRDDAAGEAFDKIGRVIGLPYPGGAAMDKLAYQGNPNALSLPSPALAGDNLDFSFSGIKTATLNCINAERQRGNTLNPADVAASLTEKIKAAVCKKTKAALIKTGAKSLVLSGGVAANSHIRRELLELCNQMGVDFFVPGFALCSDNAAMVAAAGYYEAKYGRFAASSLNARASV